MSFNFFVKLNKAINIYNNNINSYLAFIKTLVGNNSFLTYCISNIMNIFLLVSFIVMVSGFGAFFSQEFNLPSIFGAIIICLLAFIAFFKNIDGIIKISSLLIPFLIILIVLIGFKCNIFSFNYSTLFSSYSINWLLSSILYASYNSIILIPIITTMRNYINNKKQIKLISFFTTCIMIIMSVILYIVLCMNISKVNSIDIPIVYIANSFRYNF